MRTRRTLFAFVLISLALAASTWAHARLQRSAPASGTTVSPTPSRVEFWFNELLEARFNGVIVFAASELGAKNRRDFVKGKPRVDERDRTHLTADLEPLPPGEYIVEWRVLSRDGHTAPGRFTFRVRAE